MKMANCGWQKYSTCAEVFVSAVPDSLPLANAVVLPLSISTASMALFVQLGLNLPSLNPEPVGKTVLIWGGSSSCGSSAIQLAVAAGYEVATTASPTNFEYVKALGASHALDHRDPNVVEEALKVLKPGDYVFDCIASAETIKPCAELLSKIGGGKLPILNPPEQSFPENVEPCHSMYLFLTISMQIEDITWLIESLYPFSLRLATKPDSLRNWRFHIAKISPRSPGCWETESKARSPDH